MPKIKIHINLPAKLEIKFTYINQNILTTNIYEGFVHL